MLRGILAALLLAAPAQGDAPPYLMEPGTGVIFPLRRGFLDQGRPELQAVGLAVRQRAGANEYVICLYVDLKGLGARVPEGRRSLPAIARALASGEVAQGYHVRYLRDVGANARQNFLLDSLRRYWPEGAFDPASPALDRFLPYFRRDIHKDDISEVWLDGRGAIFTRLREGTVTRTDDPLLCRAWARMYMADPPKDEAMRHALIKALPGLLGPRRARPKSGSRPGGR